MTRLAGIATLGLALSACFNPTYDNPTCPTGECPSGFSCVAGVCQDNTPDTDAPPGDADIDADDTDAEIDAPSGLTCPGGWFQSPSDPSRCFGPSNISADWDTVRNDCLAMGGDLADVLDNNENQLLEQTAGLELWLGGSDPAGQMNYTWARTGAPFSYTSWAAGEPNMAFFLPACVMASGIIWYDEDCNQTRPGICVIPAT